jgi:hypothetical protein
VPDAVPAQPQTFRENSTPQTPPVQNELRPQPETSGGPGFIQPQLIRPNVSPASQGSFRQAVYYRPISMPAPEASTTKAKLDVNGWRAASK